MTRRFGTRARVIDYSGYESITVSGSASGLTTATVADHIAALITVETAAVRFRLDGTNPTSSEGTALEIGDELLLDSAQQLAGVNFIRRDGTSATLKCAYGS